MYAGRWMRENARRPFSRPVIFGVIVLGHAALVWLAQRNLMRIPEHWDEPLVLFQVAPRVTPPAALRTPVTTPPQPPAPRPAATALRPESTAVPATPGVERSRWDIDWSAEAALAAQHQIELAAAPKPRSLDDHHGHNHHDGAGLNYKDAQEFGWNYAATHRVESYGGLPLIHVGDRCVVVFLLILPTFGCGIGEIPVDGDLFKHMRDVPLSEFSSIP